MKRRLAAVLLSLMVLVLAVTAAFVPPAQASNEWRFDLSGYIVWISGEGDPDTPDLNGGGYDFKVYDQSGNAVDVDADWLIHVLMTTFGNWIDLID